MKSPLRRLYRRAVPILSAGVLLQATGCMITADEIAQGLLTSAVNAIIADFVFGAFGVPIG